MTIAFAWICTVIAVLSAVGAAYFFDRGADEQMQKMRSERQIETAELQKNVESFRRSSLELEFKLDQLRALHSRLQSKTASRKISSFQSDLIVEELRSRGRQTVEIIEFGDQEAGNYARELASTFRSAGWNVQVTRIGVMATPIFGIQVSSADPVISQALSKADVVFDAVPAGPFPRILVGLTPTTKE